MNKGDLTVSWGKQTEEEISMWCDERHDDRSSWEELRKPYSRKSAIYPVT